MKWGACSSVVMVMTAMLATAEAQSSPSDLEGCGATLRSPRQILFFFCTDAGLEHLNALLDDPANDARPYDELARQARAHSVSTCACGCRMRR